MGRRLELHAILKTITTNVYYQPPTTMAYPCIKYQFDNARSEFADNVSYRYSQRYQLTIIDQDPDSIIFDKVKVLPTCIFNRFFVADNLNHFVFTLYF